MTTELNVAVAE
jgi:hypothetical protein